MQQAEGIDRVERIVACARPVALPTHRPTVAIGGYTGFVAGRPEPMDRVERALLRLAWLAGRVRGRA